MNDELSDFWHWVNSDILLSSGGITIIFYYSFLTAR